MKEVVEQEGPLVANSSSIKRDSEVPSEEVKPNDMAELEMAEKPMSSASRDGKESSDPDDVLLAPPLDGAGELMGMSDSFKNRKRKSTNIESDTNETGFKLPNSVSNRSLAMNPSQQGHTSWQYWTHQEEVFLVGAMIERFFQRGSLSSTRKDEDGSSCWDTIKATYDMALAKYKAAQSRLEISPADRDINPSPEISSSLPSRSANAMARHYKVMKERSVFNTEMKLQNNTEGGKEPASPVNFKAMYEEWEAEYNVKFNLLDNQGNEFVPRLLVSENEEIVEEDNSNLSKKGRWTYLDEVILVGVVMEEFFKRGSLSRSLREKTHGVISSTSNNPLSCSKRSAATENDDSEANGSFWRKLFEDFMYVKAAFREHQGSASDTPTSMISGSRSEQALSRHFKVIKVRLTTGDSKSNRPGNQSVTLRPYYKDWKKHFSQYFLQRDQGQQTQSSNATVLPPPKKDPPSISNLIKPEVPPQPTKPMLVPPLGSMLDYHAFHIPMKIPSIMPNVDVGNLLASLRAAEDQKNLQLQMQRMLQSIKTPALKESVNTNRGWDEMLNHLQNCETSNTTTDAMTLHKHLECSWNASTHTISLKKPKVVGKAEFPLITENESSKTYWLPIVTIPTGFGSSMNNPQSLSYSSAAQDPATKSL